MTDVTKSDLPRIPATTRDIGTEQDKGRCALATRSDGQTCERVQEGRPGGVCGNPSTHTMSDRPYCSYCATVLRRYWDGVEPMHPNEKLTHSRD